MTCLRSQKVQMLDPGLSPSPLISKLVTNTSDSHLFIACSFSRLCAKLFYTLDHIILTTSRGKYFYLHFIKKKLEAQRSNVRQVTQPAQGRLRANANFFNRF